MQASPTGSPARATAPAGPTCADVTDQIDMQFSAEDRTQWPRLAGASDQWERLAGLPFCAADGRAKRLQWRHRTAVAVAALAGALALIFALLHLS
jgi:hypothetical protein